MCRAEEKQGSSNGKSSYKSRNEGPQCSLRRTNKNDIASYKNGINFQQMPMWIILTVLMKEFSTNLPHWISQAGRETFIPAKYKYDATNTFFDNTILTYGTDYAIAVIMTYFATKCLFARRSSTHLNNDEASWGLRWRSGALLICYAISVLAGGWAHQTYVTIESLNTTSFRILWTICVGNVTAGGGYMGMCGSEICQKLHHSRPGKNKLVYRVPIISDVVWVFYGAFMTAVCITGGISCKRPACDIFIAGVTQFVPTVYCEIVMLLAKWHDASAIEVQIETKEPTDCVANAIMRRYRTVFYIGFMLNAPLLPLYPLAIQYTSLPLGVVNALLHVNLTVSWGMQAISLHHVCKALNNTKNTKKLVPMQSH